jgi:hypothetical protein
MEQKRKRFGWLGPGAAVYALVALGAALFGAATLQQKYATPQPAYLATALMEDGRDVNLQMHGDGTVKKVVEAKYDAEGHAALPQWKAELPGLGLAIPTSPVMNWGFQGARNVAGKREPMRVCYDELRSRPAAEAAARAVVAEFARKFDLLGVEENCERPHFPLAATATQDCGGGAYGCAALKGGQRFFGYRDQHIRITIDGGAFDRGGMDAEGAKAVFGHELAHGFDRDHNSGTTAEHGHCTSTTAIYAPSGPAVGRSGCARDEYISAEDFSDEHLGLRLRPVAPEPEPPTPLVVGSCAYAVRVFTQKDGWQFTEQQDWNLPTGDHAFGVIAPGEQVVGEWQYARCN